MSEVEIQTIAIETNVRTLLKDHPNPRQFIKTLQNEAIDQAFRELSEEIGKIWNEVSVIPEILNRIEQLETKKRE